MKNTSRTVIQDGTKVKKSTARLPHRTIARHKFNAARPSYLSVVLLLVTFISFFPSLDNGFIPTWDDNVYVTDNFMIRQLDTASVKAMFTTPVNGTYVPLPLVCFAVEYALFGLVPLPYHIFSLALHLASTLLVFYFLRKLRLKNIYAFFGAILFGIHPMHVESVAWVTELKDLLFSVFYLASMIFYVRYMQEREGNRKFFVLSLVCFVLSLFSKIQAVSLPLSLFLLDYFFERRFNFRSVMEKVPFLVLSLVFGIGGLLLIGDEGALNSGGTHDLLQRVFMGTYALSAYIIKFFIPLHLSALYPIRVTAGGTLPLLYYLSPIFLLATGYFVYRSAKHTRAIVFGSLFFLVNIMFLLQIVSVGTAFMADRFTYIPYLGLAFVAAWALEKTIARGVKMIYTLTGSVVVVVVIFIALGFDRCKDWKNGETLWTDVIRKYPTESSRPYSNRSVLYNEKGQWDLSIADCSKAISINPDDAHAYSNRSVAFANKGEWSNALSDCNRAIGIDPRFANAFTNRGNAYLGLRDWRNAVADYNAAIRINPNEGNAYANCGVAYGNMEEWNKAVDCLSKAITIDPKNVKAYSNRGWVFVSLKKPDKALADYSSAIGIDPGYATAYFNRGTVYGDLGNWDKAIADYSKAIEIDPQMQVAYKNREIAYRYVTGNR